MKSTLYTFIVSMVILTISCQTTSSDSFAEKWRGSYKLEYSTDWNVLDTFFEKDFYENDYIIVISPINKNTVKVTNLFEKGDEWQVTGVDKEGALYISGEVIEEEDGTTWKKTVTGYFIKTKDVIEINMIEKSSMATQAPVYKNYSKTETTLKSTEDSDVQFETKTVTENYDSKKDIDFGLTYATFTHKGIAKKAL